MISATHNDISVLVVDDSLYMRGLISAIISDTQGMRCIGTAINPLDAREKIKQLNPDVLTLDIEMPGMNGIDFLEKIMRLRPMPVIMVSSLTTKGADAAVQALSIGAVSCVGKPENDEDRGAFKHALIESIQSAVCVDVHKNTYMAPASISVPAVRELKSDVRQNRSSYKKNLIMIGASTGGVSALDTILPALGADAPPVVVVQHMAPLFTASLASRLHRLCPACVKETQNGDLLQPGTIYIAEGAKQCTIRMQGNTFVIDSGDTEHVSGHCPSIDRLFISATDAGAAPFSVGVILTGMGGDGAEGLKLLRAAGGRTIGQDEQTSLIYGMPRAAFLCGAVEEQAPLQSIGERILRLCGDSS